MSKYINSLDQNHEISDERECACLSLIVHLNSTLEWFDIKCKTIGKEAVLTKLVSKDMNSADQNCDIAEECKHVCLSSIDLLSSMLDWFNIKYITIILDFILLTKQKKLQK